jgi:predicted enzyme related to lactoylglutathione lyase
MNRVIHFEIHAADPERAAKFYGEVFGWEIKEWIIPGVDIPDENRYWLVGTGPEEEPGINGGIMFRRGPAPEDGQSVNSYICTIGVTSVDDTIAKALKAGAALTVPKMPVKGVGWLAYCKDTEGNIFGIMQNDENAE